MDMLKSFSAEQGTDTQTERFRPMSETEMLELSTQEVSFGYPATEYRTTHPDTVDPSKIAKMTPEEFNDFLVAITLVEDYRSIPKSMRPASQRL